MGNGVIRRPNKTNLSTIWVVLDFLFNQLPYICCKLLFILLQANLRFYDFRMSQFSNTIRYNRNDIQPDGRAQNKCTSVCLKNIQKNVFGTVYWFSVGLVFSFGVDVNLTYLSWKDLLRN